MRQLPALNRGAGPVWSRSVIPARWARSESPIPARTVGFIDPRQRAAG
jgi:hypothetical protein